MMKCNADAMSEKKINTDRKILYSYIVSLIIVAIFIVSSFVVCIVGEISRLRPEYIIDVSIDVTGVILCGILIFSLAKDKPWSSQNRALFRVNFSLCMLFYLDMASSFMEGNPRAAGGVLFVNSLLFFVEVLLIYCFWTYIREEMNISKKEIPIVSLVCKGALIAEMIVDVLNYFFGFIFMVDAAGEYVPGRFHDYSEIISAVIYVTVLVVIIRAKECHIREKLLLLTFLIFPIMASIISVVFDKYAVVYPTYLFAVMLIYINVFARKNKLILEQQVTLDRQSTALMISQIQPHFLYNVLTTIGNLCVTDPEEAEETTVLFSQYLRTNLDSLRKTEPVPFSAELGHIRTYVELEKKRFGDKLNYEINCPETGFLVPSLGLQPIVENSIKHGIRGKDSPGHLKISSTKKDTGFEVIIEDDGIGFDPNEPVKDDGRSHVGMNNVRTRLKQMCGATMDIVSSPGNGCVTRVFFPQE